MNIGFLSELNLHLTTEDVLDRFLGHISDCDKKIDVLCLAGNIADSESVFYFLRRIRVATSKPIIFVFGDNDLAYQSIDHMNKEAKFFCNSVFNVHYLHSSSIEIQKITFYGCSIFPSICANNKYNKIYELSRERYNEDRLRYNKYSHDLCIGGLNSVFSNVRPDKMVIMSYYSPYHIDGLHSSELGSCIDKNCSISKVTVLCHGLSPKDSSPAVNANINLVANSGRELKIVSV